MGEELFQCPIYVMIIMLLSRRLLAADEVNLRLSIGLTKQKAKRAGQLCAQIALRLRTLFVAHYTKIASIQRHGVEFENERLN